MLSKGLSRVFSNTTFQKHQFFSAQLSVVKKYMFFINNLILWIKVAVSIFQSVFRIKKTAFFQIKTFLSGQHGYVICVANKHFDEKFSLVTSLSHVRLFVTPWTKARQASLSITNSQSLLRLMSIESVMPSNHLILCHPLLLLPSIFPSIRVFSNELAL